MISTGVPFRNLSSLVRTYRRKPNSVLVQFSRQTSDQPPSRYRFDQARAKKNLQPVNFLLLIFPATTLGLGIWQTKRRAWKLDLIKQLEEKTSVPPILLPDDYSEVEDLEYQKVFVQGYFDHSREAYIGPKSIISNEAYESGGGLFGNPDAVGYQVITPFFLDGREGETILINRGWIPRRNLNPATRPQGQIQGPIDLIGIVRKTEIREQFAPKNHGNTTNVWSYRDISDMSQRLGTLPVFLDADADSTVPGGPIGGQTKVTLRNDHLSYMFTWYSLTGAMVYLWVKRFVYKM